GSAADEPKELAEAGDLLGRAIQVVVEREAREPGVEIRPQPVGHLLRRAGGEVCASLGGDAFEDRLPLRLAPDHDHGAADRALALPRIDAEGLAVESERRR